MTSSYPALAGRRMPLDVDGSTLHTVTDGIRTELDNVSLQVLNNEADDDLGFETAVGYYLLAFPELRNVTGLYLGVEQADPADWVDITVEGSQDTLTGVDGTWFEMAPSSRVQTAADTYGPWGHIQPGDYRRYVRYDVTGQDLHALRVVVTPQTPGTTAWRLNALHCYGDVSANTTHADRLKIWHPTDDVPIPPGYFDWGDVPYQSSADRTFRVKNLSPSKRADSVVLAMDALTDADPSVVGQHLLSYAASAYSSHVTIPSIAPGALSKLVTLRRVTPSTAVAGPWAIRLRTQTGGWTEVSA